VLFIAVDDLNDWVLGGRPGIRAPNIQRLLARGTLFANAHCASPSCHPSRLSVMTGVRPSTSGIDHNVYAQREASWRTGPNSGTGALAKAVVLSQHFRQHGWRAAGTGKIFHGLQWVDGTENEPAPEEEPVIDDVFYQDIDDKDFRPSEEIPADQSIPFPSDI
jgi:arylsulfatase A-like enzyme